MLTFKISTIDHNTYYYCSMFIIPTTGQNPNWNSPVHIAFFKIPTAKIQLIIIPTTDQNPNRNFPVQIAFFIIPTSHNPYKVKSRTQLKSLRTQLKSLPTQLKSLLTQLKSLRTQLKSLQTQLKSLRVGIMIVGILIVGILKPSRIFSCPEQLNRTHCPSLGPSVTTNNQSLHNITEWS